MPLTPGSLVEPPMDVRDPGRRLKDCSCSLSFATIRSFDSSATRWSRVRLLSVCVTQNQQHAPAPMRTQNIENLVERPPPYLRSTETVGDCRVAFKRCSHGHVPRGLRGILRIRPRGHVCKQPSGGLLVPSGLLLPISDVHRLRRRDRDQICKKL